MPAACAIIEESAVSNQPLPASFRDPNGVLLILGGRVLRIVTAAGMGDLSALLASSAASRWSQSGALVRTVRLDADQERELRAQDGIAGLYESLGGAAILEHERIPFPSFPYEWPPELLDAAARLTLDLAMDLLPEGLGVKDATPYNILFRGPDPVFIDATSIERRDAGDPTWLAYAQFIRAFVLPLLANRRFGLPLDQALLARRDGLEPEEVYRWLGPLERLHPSVLPLVSMPVWLAARHRTDDASVYKKKLLPDPERARFVLEHLLKGLRRTLDAFAPKTAAISAWTGYMEGGNNYTAGQFQAKERFVAAFLGEHAPKRVLDAGCNTGYFSFLAARSGASVVAIDYDPAAAGGVWRTARAEKLDVLPLVVNLARPTPAMGWNNREWPSFLERARGAFDAVFMLAVVHHMLVSERVPLDAILDLAADLTTEWLVVEFVSPEDSMFRRLVRGREELFRGLDAARFEEACRRRFDILETQHLEGATRWLYVLRRKPK
jgi:SAM-dependent methyltransferase